jgi:5-methylcytosine-specific restriction enzyme subunit McrC
MNRIGFPETIGIESRRRIDLKEWESCEVLLKEAELRDLLRCPPTILRMQSIAKGYTRLQAAATVGQIRFGSVDVRILPKYPMTSLMTMLAEVYELTRLDPYLMGYATVSDPTELLIHIFLYQTGQVIRKGLKRSYVAEEDVLKTVRGKIDVRRSVEIHLRGQVALQCQYEDRTLENSENRLLLKALRRIAYGKSVRLNHRNLAHQLALEFEGLRDDTSESVPWETFKTDRLNRHYFPALPLAKLILEGTGIAHEFGVAEADGFLINMNQLFESFVCRRLETSLGAKRVKTWTQRRSWFDETRVAEIKPDFIAQAPHGRRVVLDTKYKLGSEPNSGDLYQMLSYCRVLDICHGLLVSVGAGERTILKVNDGITTIEAIPVDLSGSTNQIDESMQRLTNRLLQLLDMPS